MNMAADQPKKGAMEPKVEGPTPLETEIPTAPIMIGSEMKKPCYTSEARQYQRKKSTPAIHYDDQLSAHLASMQLSERPAATMYVTSGHQRRRASVDDASMDLYQAKGHASEMSQGAGPRGRRVQRLSPALFEEQGSYTSDKRIVLYKTEMCRTFEETGICKYGIKCQFAHDRAELRNIQRHPRYKTEICRTFWEQGQCPYGKRCCFIHTENELAQPAQSPSENMIPAEEPEVGQHAESRILNRLHKTDPISASLPATSFFNLDGINAPRTKSSYREDHFLDFLSAGPIGSAPGNFFSIGCLSNKHLNQLPTIQDPLFESISIPSDAGHSDSHWDDESIGLLPADLINNAD